MQIKITLLYTGLLGLAYFALSLNVVRLRWKFKLGIGLPLDPKSPLFRAIRIHGNFMEYIPFMLFLLAMDEVTGQSSIALHAMGSALFLSRGLHFLGISRTHGISWQRFIGTSLTLMTLVCLSANLLIKGLA